MVGKLVIAIDPFAANEGFVDRSILVIITGIVRNILLSFILVFVFYYTTTKRILAVSHALTDLDIKNPSKSSIPVIESNELDELSDLVNSVNRMLGVISSDIKELEAREFDLRASEVKLVYQANHDSLTGLVNRRGFEERLQCVLENNRMKKIEHALCYLDLDQFKVINDTCGHIAGDELLRQVSQVLKGGVRKNDLIARLGGDEFGILMEYCDLEHASIIAKELCEKVEDYSFVWDYQRFSIGVSIGVVPITGDEKSTIDVLRKADVACYAAKDAGRHCVHAYDPGNQDLERLQGEMKWATRVSQALEENRFKLFAQAIAPMARTGRDSIYLHYEVLLRMVDRDSSIIPPGVFLPAAERYNLITKLDHWVLDELFGYLKNNPDHLERLSICSVNLSGQSLTVPGFQDFIIEKLDNFKIPPEKICFEITETAAVTNMTVASKFISDLRNKGCLFALDDFGTGLSSFGYLKNLPVDYLKIDGVFVKDIVDDPIDFAMVKSIHEIAQVMGMKTIAEFVENNMIMEKLKEIGVDYAQGYGISKPVPIEEHNRNISKVCDEHCDDQMLEAAY